MTTTAPPTLWQKQILSDGIADFNTERLTRIVEMFDPAQPVPFTFSDSTNAMRDHAGTLTGLSYYPGEGVFGHFELTEGAARHVARYPRFGTTAIVSQDTITSVQGTNTPQIPGMAGWEKVTTEAPQPEEHNLSEEQLNNEGDRKMSKLDASNLDPNVQLRLEQFVEQYCGASMSGQSPAKVIELAMELAVGREHAFAEALTGQEIIQKGLATNDEMHAWIDAYGA